MESTQKIPIRDKSLWSMSTALGYSYSLLDPISLRITNRSAEGTKTKLCRLRTEAIINRKYLNFKKILLESKKRQDILYLKSGCSLHAYVIITYHLHLLATPKEKEQLATIMQSLANRYVRFNAKNKRTGFIERGVLNHVQLPQ